MSDYLSWYSIELRTRLAPHLTSADCETIVKEAESHLRESAENLKAELQLSDEQAALTAIDAFGKPEQVALTHLRTLDPRIIGIKPIYLVLACAVIAVLCWDFELLSLSGPFDNYGETWQNGLAGWIGSLALAGFVFACRVGKRSFRFPVLGLSVALVVVLPAFACFFAITNGSRSESVLRPRVAAAVKTIPASLARLDRLESFFKRGKADFASAKSASDLPPDLQDLHIAESEFGIDRDTSYPAFAPDGQRIEKAFVTPVDYVYSPARGGLYALRGEAEFAEAKKRWATVTDAAISRIGITRRDLREVYAHVQQARSGRLFFPNGPLVVDVVGCTVLFLPVLVLLEWATFTIVRRKRAWPIRSLA